MTEDRIQMTENRRQRTEVRSQMTENRRQRTEVRSQMTENRRQGTEDFDFGSKAHSAEGREHRVEGGTICPIITPCALLYDLIPAP